MTIESLDYIDKCKFFLDCKYAVEINELKYDGEAHLIYVDHLCGWIIYYLDLDDKILKYDFIKYTHFYEITGDSKIDKCVYEVMRDEK